MWWPLGVITCRFKGTTGVTPPTIDGRASFTSRGNPVMLADAQHSDTFLTVGLMSVPAPGSGPSEGGGPVGGVTVGEGRGSFDSGTFVPLVG